LRLKSTVDLSPFPPEIQRIFRAMQRYGLIVADNGSDMYVSGVFDPRWNNDVLNSAFRAFNANDFEVIELGWNGGTCAPPLPPQALSSTVTGQLVQLNWLAPAGGGQQDYVLEAGTSPGLTNAASMTLPNSPSFSVVAPPGAYYVRARARNACGTSAVSNEIVVHVSGCVTPAAPANFRFSRAGSLVTLLWDATPTASDYVVEVGSVPGASNLLVAPLAGSPVSTVAPPGTYYVRVRARNGCGAGSPSNEATIVI
jgi:hypothetical protein